MNFSFPAEMKQCDWGKFNPNHNQLPQTPTERMVQQRVHRLTHVCVCVLKLSIIKSPAQFETPCYLGVKVHNGNQYSLCNLNLKMTAAAETVEDSSHVCTLNLSNMAKNKTKHMYTFKTDTEQVGDSTRPAQPVNEETGL